MGLSLWARPKVDWPGSACWRQDEIWHTLERSQCLACQALGVGVGQSLLCAAPGPDANSPETGPELPGT